MRPLTLNTAKPLLPIGGQPLVDYVLRRIDEIDEVGQIYVVVNDRFFEDFRVWAEQAPTSKEIVLVNDGSICNENRLGAIADINLVVETEGIQDDLLVVGGDNLFDFGLQEFVSFFRGKGTSVGLHVCDDPELVKKYSAVDLDGEARVVSFEEKPERARSNLVAICLYLFEKVALPFLKQYLDEGGNPDAPGHYIEWLHEQIPVYGKILEGWWCDIGNERTYREADKLYAERDR